MALQGVYDVLALVNYNIHNQPKSIEGNMWREVFLKHSNFEYQSEYRAAFFASDYFFNRILANPMVIQKKIFTQTEKPMDFNLELCVKSGIDEEGWRYIEIDISKFAANISPESSKIIELNENPR